MATLYTTEHRTVSYVSGPLIVAERASRSRLRRAGRDRHPGGQRRRGQVLELEGDHMVVQVLGGTRGLDVASTTVLTRARAARMPVGPDLHRPRPRRHGPALRRRAAASAGSRARPQRPAGESRRARASRPSSSKRGSRRSTGSTRSCVARSSRCSRAMACPGSSSHLGSPRERASATRTKASSWCSPRSA